MRDTRHAKATKESTAIGKPARRRGCAWARWLLVVAAIAFCLPSPARAAAECELWEPLTFADLDWDSARLHTGIASYIVREGYGCPVDLVPGGTVDSFARLSTGVVDAMMEVWKDNFLESWDMAEESGQVVDAGVNFDRAQQGWFVPRFMIEGDSRRGIKPLAPDLKSVGDLARYSHLFADQPGAKPGVFMNCVPTWSCEPINTKKLKIYGLAKHFANRHPKDGDALAAYIKERYEKGLPFLAYHWRPSSIAGTYDVVMLEEPPYDEAVWNVLAGAGDARQATAYPVSTVHKGANFTLELEAPELLAFLERYRMPTALVSDLLAAWRGEGRSRDEIVSHFLTTRPDVWKPWVPDPVAKRIEASLDEANKARPSPAPRRGR